MTGGMSWLPLIRLGKRLNCQESKAVHTHATFFNNDCCRRPAAQCLRKHRHHGGHQPLRGSRWLHPLPAALAIGIALRGTGSVTASKYDASAAAEPSTLPSRPSPFGSPPIGTDQAIDARTASRARA